MRLFYLIILGILLVTPAFVKAEESMDDLLDTYAHNSDLSKKTRLQNAGNVTVYTREELEKMQARNLKDIFKTLPTLNYAENRWGLSDPVYIAHTLPFNSNAIRIYIDNQEVSSASYGSGLFYLGNIDIGFVDHIEVYTLNPSFEYSTEPARYLIKLYSKVAERDRGAEVKVSNGSYGFNQESFQYAGTTDELSYYTYISRMDDKRKRYYSFGHPLSRDQERYFLFGTLSNKDHLLQIQAIKNDEDMFLGLSSDGRTFNAGNESEYYHIGYEYRAIKDFTLKLVWETGAFSGEFLNDYETLKLTTSDKIFTMDTQYRYNQIANNELMLGVKFRYKHFTVDKMEFAEVEYPKADYDTQTIYSAYLEDHYALNENWLLTLGIQFSHVGNNDIVEDQNVWMARLGLIYSDEYWAVKTFIHRSAFLVEPYRYNTTATIHVLGSLEPEVIKNITQEVRYKNDEHTFRVVAGYNRIENENIHRAAGKVLNSDITGYIHFLQLEYAYKFDIHNSLSTNFSYKHMKDMHDDETTEDYDEYKGVVRLLNRYKKFDFYNEFIYNHNTIMQKNYLDYSVGVTYRYNENLIFSLKGENLFDRAREDRFYRGKRDFETGDWLRFKPLDIAAIDQRVYFTVEYRF